MPANRRIHVICNMEVFSMTSLQQIAKLAGVSAMTVSRALRDNPHVLPETKARILALAKMYHYQPNRVFQGVISGKQNAIGCILPAGGWSYYSQILSGVMDRVEQDTFQTHIMKCDDMIQIQRAIQTCIEHRVTGIVLTSGLKDPIPKEALVEMWSYGIVAVIVGPDFVGTPIDRVLVNEDELATLMLDYLCDLGHRDIAYVGVYNPTGHWTANITRENAIRAALHKRGLSTAYFATITEDERTARDLLITFMEHPNPPTAIITFIDDIAAILLQQAIPLGIRIPKDISVIGCGNFQYASYTFPRLTSVEHYPLRMGTLAAELLLERFAEQLDTGKRKTVTLPPTLVERKSCAPATSASDKVAAKMKQAWPSGRGSPPPASTTIPKGSRTDSAL
ncbi:MAG TPA: LacI family DNA-binding transcriptional regulator [Armatimonadota bacterium]|nr:LacI family DNA-binding transcriptional regulator [Armatimonadota bacterium]